MSALLVKVQKDYCNIYSCEGLLERLAYTFRFMDEVDVMFKELDSDLFLYGCLQKKSLLFMG